MNSFHVLLALLVALLATSALAGDCTPAGSCTDASSGFCYTGLTGGNSYCSCHSGRNGADCSNAVTGCSPFNNINDTVTEYAPISVNASFAANFLNVAIFSPLVAQRNYTIIAVDDSAFDDEPCVYPGPNWSKDFDNCRDVFLGSMPWSTNVACGWTNDNSGPSLSVYSAQMVVEHHDITTPFENRTGGTPVERITQHVIPLTVSFPKNVAVSSNITVQSPIKLLTAISRQSLSADHATATIEITTNVIWPYQLSAFAITGNTGTATSYTESFVSQTCPNNGASCTQVWRIAIVNGPACNLNAIVALNWTLNCQLNGTGVEPPECAIQAGDGVTAVLVLNSEDFCTAISTSLPIAGSLASFGDSAFTRPKTNFLVGQTLYYVATAVSPNVTLNGATINSVKLTSLEQTPDVLLYASSTATADGIAGSFGLDANDNDSAGFHFTLSPTFIDALGDDSSRLYTTVVVVDVDFLNTVTNKRGVMSVAFTSKLQSQPVNLAASFQAGEESADASALTAGALTLGAAVIINLF